MSIFDTVMALLATSLGAGTLSISYATYHIGMFYGIAAVIVMMILAHFSMMMYVKTMELTPSKSESVYEIAYLLSGRTSIFVICSILFVTNFGSVVLFYMMSAEALSSVITDGVVRRSDSSEKYEEAT